MDALDKMKERNPANTLEVLTASDEASNVLNALDRGAMGFIPKCSSNAVIVNAIQLVLSGGLYVPPQAGGARPPPPAAPHPPAQTASIAHLGLTERQGEVLALMVQGLPNKVICRKLNLAEGTVKIHVTAILKALNVANRTQAVIAASQTGLKLRR